MKGYFYFLDSYNPLLVFANVHFACTPAPDHFLKQDLARVHDHLLILPQHLNQLLEFQPPTDILVQDVDNWIQLRLLEMLADKFFRLLQPLVAINIML